MTIQLSPSGSFFPVNKTTALVVGTTSANVAINFSNGSGYQAFITNAGTQTVFFALGVSGEVSAQIPTSASEYGIPLPANSTITIHIGSATYIAAIASATGSTLYITTGSTI